MQFSDDKPIWRQIYELIAMRILSDEWPEGSRIVSVRELAQEVGVNPNTVMRSYERLDGDGIIFNRRGIGYFVAEDAQKRASAIARERFITEQLPSLFAKMKSIGITAEEILTLYNEYENK